MVRELCASLGVPAPTDADRAAVLHDLAAGRALHVVGSPHFITASGDFFCPSLSIRHDDGGYSVTVDPEGFSRFVRAVFG